MQDKSDNPCLLQYWLRNILPHIFLLCNLRVLYEGLQDYLKNVRSIIFLFTRALTDAAAYLGRAIATHEQGHEKLG